MVLKGTEWMLKPGLITIVSFISNTVMGLIFSLIASIFIKKEQAV
jgi:hypothetical protein